VLFRMIGESTRTSSLTNDGKNELNSRSGNNKTPVSDVLQNVNLPDTKQSKV
jgi:hypothetical protein